MVRKLVELPKFLVFNSGTNSFWNNSVFCFLLTTVRFILISVVAFLYGVGDIFMSAFQMEFNDYPHSTSPRMGHCVPRASIAWGF
jgi:hypothetical protein